MIRDATPSDADALAAIYNYYIRETVVTFEEEPVDAAEMERRRAAIAARHCWLVVEDAARVAGYAYAAPWHARAAYRRSVETTIYLAPDVIGRGVGRALYAELLARLPEMGVHTAIGGVALPNPASVALHERFGYRKAAHYRQVGHKFGRWIDVGYWQLLLAGQPITKETPA